MLIRGGSSTNWTKTEPGGSDGYMYLEGKIGVCVECGPIARADEYKEFAKKTLYQFLKHFGMSTEDVRFSTANKRIIEAKKAIYKKSEDFVILPGFKNFDKLKSGQVMAREGAIEYKAKEGECIIFPHYKARVGEEAYITGEEIE
jgi:succinylglutamate desuccinylase